MTVVEFSLTPDTKQKLEDVLKPYVKGEETDFTGLGAIFSNPDNFPKEVLAELERFGKTKSSKTVYIVRNLPEISPGDIPSELKITPHPPELNDWLIAHTYSAFINQGIAQAIGLSPKQREVFTLVRPDDGRVIGGSLHKHKSEIDMLGGIMTDGAPTRFTDFHTLLEQVEEDPTLQNIPLYQKPIDSLEAKRFSLGAFNKQFQHWRESNSFSYDTNAKHEAQFEKLVTNHSYNIVIGAGDLALWANDGHLMHQALLSPQISPVDQIYRIAVGSGNQRL